MFYVNKKSLIFSCLVFFYINLYSMEEPELVMPTAEEIEDVNDFRQLLEDICTDNWDGIKYAIEILKFDANFRDAFGNNALYTALINAKYYIARYLISYGAKGDDICLYYAKMHKFVDIVEILSKQKEK